jgi:hypothetical protein
MEEKYYTPNIEDIRVGYEFEQLYENTWEKSTYSTTHISLFNLYHKIELGQIRVSYLTKEQIEIEGWEFTTFPIEIEGTDKDVFVEGWEKTINEDLWYTLRKEGNLLIIEKRWYINQVSQVWETLFKGECKDINKFRTICKLLKI